MARPVPDISSRHRFEARVAIHVQRSQQNLNLQGWVRDLSESGLRAFVADCLLLGESVTFEIPLSDAVNQIIPAKVMRARGTDYGFQFTALSAEQRTGYRPRSRNPRASTTTKWNHLVVATRSLSWFSSGSCAP
jgi:PilZ domain